jgi:hypothetical protein
VTDALRRRAEIDRKLRVQVPEPSEPASDRLLALGVPEEVLQTEPEIVDRNRAQRFNREWLVSVPPAEREKALTIHVIGVSPAQYDQLDAGETGNPHGERLTRQPRGRRTEEA